MARMPRRSVLLFVAAIFFAGAAPASAGYVTVEEESEARETEERLAFYDDDGEKNSLSVATDGEQVLVTDSARPLEAVRPCVAETARRARCPTIGEKRRSYGIQYFYVFLGGGNDRVDLAEYTTPGAALVEGYGGADVILGTNGGDSLMGGSGRDRIDGRGGDDDIEGDGWWFEENEEPNAKAVADVIDGGAGDDDITAESGHSPEDNGGRGNDRVRGGAGNDEVTAQWRPKVLKGGPGDDLVEAIGRPRNWHTSVVCGPGEDRANAFKTDRVARDCERARVGSLLLTTAPEAFDASGEILFSAECTLARSRRCKGTLRLVAGGATAAASAFSIQGQDSAAIEIALKPHDAQRVAGRGRVFSFRAGGLAGFKMRVKASEA